MYKKCTSFLLFVLCAIVTSAQETVSFPSADGLEITADIYEVNTDYPYIILCHQAGYSRGEYRVTAERLNKLGFNCLAIDQRSGDRVNNVVNETYSRAKQQNMKTEYLDAEQDIVAAVEYIYKKNSRKVVLLGSSYSASLVLKIANGNDKVLAVAAFSPGEYFGDQLNVANSLKGLNIPVYATSSKKESDHVKEVLQHVDKKHITYFTPGTEGKHGSKALWKSNPSNQEYWLTLIRFLTNVKEMEG